MSRINNEGQRVGGLANNQDKFLVKLLGRLNTLRCEDVLCDVTITADGHEFSAHKGVLAASSDYFKSIFTTPMIEKYSKTINLEVCPSIIDDLLTFLYTGTTRVCESNVNELLVAADYLVVDELKLQCSYFLAQSLSAETCLEICALAEQCQCRILTDQCERFVLNHFTLIRTSEFSSLDCHQLERIIQHDELVVDEERQVYEAIISWLTSDIPDRQQYLDRLFGHVRLCSLTDGYIRDNIETQPLVSQSTVCKELVRQKLQDKDYTKQPRKCLRPERQAFVTVGGICWGKALNAAMAWIPNTDNEWLPLPGLAVEREEHVVVACQGLVYAIGGMKRVRDIECYDPRTNTWSTVASLPGKAIASAGVCLDEKIFIMGGKDGSSSISSVYSYDPSSHLVQVLPPLTFSRKALCAVPLNGEIYAIGGCTNDSDSLNVVEKMRPSEGVAWQRTASMKIHRKYACAEVLASNTILVVGGYQEISPTALNSCEVYNPETNEWQVISNLVFPRAAAAMACIDGHVYVMGGRSDRQSTDTIECYHQHHDQWCVATTTLPYPCAWFQGAVIPIDSTKNASHCGLWN